MHRLKHSIAKVLRYHWLLQVNRTWQAHVFLNYLLNNLYAIIFAKINTNMFRSYFRIALSCVYTSGIKDNRGESSDRCHDISFSFNELQLREAQRRFERFYLLRCPKDILGYYRILPTAPCNDIKLLRLDIYH